MTEQKNLLIAIVLSVAVLLTFNIFVDGPRHKQKLAAQQAAQTMPATAAPAASPAAPAIIAVDTARTKSPRLAIDTPKLKGSINLRGGLLDDLQLADYYTTQEHKEIVTLLSPAQTAEPYFVMHGWLAGNDTTIPLPDDNTLWQADGKTLTPSTPVTLRYDNKAGLLFERKITIDDNYVFTIHQTVKNTSEKNITLYPFAKIVRPHKPAFDGHYRGQTASVQHEGPVAFLDQDLLERNYTQMTEDGKDQTILNYEAKTGWLGLTDKYWLVALVPPQDNAIAARFVRNGGLEKTGTWPFRKVVNDTRDYQVDYRAAPLSIAPGSTAHYQDHLFTGAKEVSILDMYENTINAPRFDLAVDFGWFYFLTKPIFYALDWLGTQVGNFGIAILIFTVFIRLLVFPLASQSARSMAKMKILAPRLKELQTKHKDDPAKLQSEMMAFYKKEKFNPLSGCLPILIQIPIFFALYKVLYVTLEMRQAPFYGWIRDLSAPDPTSLFNLFGLIPWSPPAMLMIGALPILFGLTMWLQMKLSPTTPDPIQQKMFAYMPLIFTFIMAHFPAGLLLYWCWSNTLGIVQQYIIMKQVQDAESANT